MLHDPSIDIGHKPEACNCRKERLWAHQATMRLEPEQRLVMRDGVCGYMQQRLVVQDECIVLQGVTNTAHPIDVLNHPLALFARQVVKFDAIAPVCFRRLARHIGLGDDFVGPEARRGDCRDSDTALEMKHIALLDMAEAPHLLQHLVRDRSCLPPRDVPQQHHEFISPETRNKVVRTNRVPQLLRSELEQLVAGGMPAGVVDVFELIEVPKAQSAPRPPGGACRNLSLELRCQPVPAVETGEGVVVHDMQQALLAFIQRGERIAKGCDDRLSFPVTRNRKAHLHPALGYMGQRLLEFR